MRSSRAELAGVEPTLATTVLSTQLGRFRLCFRIATGGMATVYLARADGGAGLQLLVALKRIHPHLAAAPGFVEMFLDEARIASRIRHPNVCAVLDFEGKGALSYLVMEYLMGESLMQVLRALARMESMGMHEAVRIAKVVADACEGLHAAHELTTPTGEPLEVVHRDVSPQNLFLTYEGVVKVVDFGVASAAHRTHETKTGMLKGKLAYLPPEALTGKPIDRRGDVWGLGVVLWELLAGRRLFARATDAETVRALSDPIVPPSESRNGVPRALDAIVLRALHRNVGERYATARELGRDLSHFVAQQGQSVGPAELSEWMDELFPAGRACARQIIDLAEQMDPIEPATLDPEPSPAPRPSSTPARKTAVRRRFARSRPSVALAAAVCSLLVATAAAALSLSGNGPPEVAGPAAPPPAIEAASVPPESLALGGPTCESPASADALPVDATMDPLVFEIRPELGEDGRVVLRVRSRFTDPPEPRERSSRPSRGRRTTARTPEPDESGIGAAWDER